MRKYLSTLLVASVLIASCSKDAEVIREKIVSQSRPILSGQGQPDNGKGEDGDYYLDLTNAKLYGPKTQGAWGEPSLDLRGLPGKDGKDGKDGQNGQDGQPGRDGQNGTNGTNGESPRIGDNGNWWVGNTDLGVKAQGAPGQNGQDGQNGANGRDGQDGRDGQNGTNGATPRIGDNGNWWVGDTDLGVKAQGNPGQNGRDGRDGQNGTNGRDGQNGTNGVTPQIGNNGNWWIGDQDTGKPARGIPGANGRDGNNGFTPYIGPNGNWWVDNRDTGKPARGESGAPGRNGQNGADGSKILAEDRAPQATDGVKGDYFIDKAAKIFYGPKTDAGWPTTGIYLGTNQILSADYQLSEDGKTLIKWLNGQTRVIDMNTDPKLKLVERIEENAFNVDNNNITYQLATIIIGDRIREIGQYAFNKCKKLKEVEIPEGVTQINSATFANCYNLSSIQLPESLTKVGNGSFANNFRLSTIILPKNVNEIGNNAFKNCPNLHSIILENRTAFAIKSIQFGIGNINNETLQHIFVPKGTKSAYQNLMIENTYKYKVKEVGI